jgi:hypothetical protein
MVSNGFKIQMVKNYGLEIGISSIKPGSDYKCGDFLPKVYGNLLGKMMMINHKNLGSLRWNVYFL